jgi:hypothetical protein
MKRAEFDMLRVMPDPVSRLRVTIAAMMASIVLAVALSIGASPARAQQSASSPPETHLVLVVPVNLRGRTPLTVDRAQIAQALFGAQNSVASRYRAISYGQLDFVGTERDIADPITLAEPADFCNTGLGHLADAAQAEMRRRGVPLADYQHIAFLLPKDAPCWWTGLGDIGGNRVWVKATTAKAFQHELGHNLGMNHAVNWRSSDAEGSDFMGSGATSLNAPHVVSMGWLRNYPAKVVEFAVGADVTLETLEADPRRSALPKVAIVRPAPGANTYYLSYRGSGPANPLSEAFTSGLNIHIADPARRGGLTYFVASLADGATYTDGPMILQQVSHRAGESVTVRISFAGTGPAIPAGPPPAPPGTVQSLASGKCLDLPGGQSGDGTAPIQYACRGGPNQLWNIETGGNTGGDAGSRIVSRLAGKCIGADPGGPVALSACDASPAQRWTLDDTGDGFVIKNAATHFCLDVPGGSLADGAKPIAWSCNGGPNQVWRYVSPSTP